MCWCKYSECIKLVDCQHWFFEKGGFLDARAAVFPHRNCLGQLRRHQEALAINSLDQLLVNRIAVLLRR